MENEKPEDPAPADDLLFGIGAIADFLGMKKRRVEYLIQTGVLTVGIGREGHRWIGSKRKLRAERDRRTSGALAPEEKS